MTARDSFLQQVKSAVAEGNRLTEAPSLPERGRVGDQGGGADPAQRFCQELAAAGGTGYLATDESQILQTIQTILTSHHARKILLSQGGLIERLNLSTSLTDCGMEVRSADDGADRDVFFAADVGITNVHRLIAETGTVVMSAKPDEPRSISLLPPVHICLAERSQLLPDLFDLFDLYAPNPSPIQSLPPSCLSLITGPSKTGDIELRLVTGVHGPGEVHVILCPW